jgi:teichuronic acid biosynthesis glycosyltransferase TuaC
LARKYDKPHVLTAHGSDIHTIPFQTKRSRHHVLTTLKEAEKVIFVSNELLTQARKLGFDGKNALVIYNGIDSRHFYRRELTVAEGFTGIKKCNFTIGFVGNLEFVKGADLLPDIFSELQDKYRELQFIIVGHGTYRNQIQNNLKRKNVNFHMTGAIENKNLPYYLSLMDFLVMPSRNEGFGIVALEAQACGVAVIGRAVGGLKEIIKDKNYLVDASDDRTLINGIKFKFSNLLKSRSTEINELVEIYSLDRCIMMQLNLYSDFISRGRRKK